MHLSPRDPLALVRVEPFSPAPGDPLVLVPAELHPSARSQ